MCHIGVEMSNFISSLKLEIVASKLGGPAVEDVPVTGRLLNAIGRSFFFMTE